MACLLIVDDDTGNARQLADVLSAELSAKHDIVCSHGLADYRRLRRRHKPDLILVELLRHQSNGFSLAAALARQSSARVVLLTDRELASDRLWAAARGINDVLSRRCGRRALALQIGALLETGVLPASEQPATSPGSQLLSGTGIQALLVTPEAALLNSLADELRQLSPVQDWSTITVPEAERLNRLQNLLVYISDADIRHSLQALIHLSEAQARAPDLLWWQAREKVLILLEPAAYLRLEYHCQEEWGLLCQLVAAESGWSKKHAARLRHLLGALTFLPMVNAAADVRHPDGSAETAVLVGYTESVLDPLLITGVSATAGSTAPGSTTPAIKTLTTTASLRALASLRSGGHAIGRVALRDLARSALIWRAASASQDWRPLLDCCIDALYGWGSGMPETVTDSLVYVVLRQLSFYPDMRRTDTTHADASQDAAPEPDMVNTADNDSLPADLLNKLSQSICGVSQLLTQKSPLHQRLAAVMVSVYKLRSLFGLSAPQGVPDNKSHRCWQRVIACVYELVCHGVLRPEQLKPADISDLNKCLLELVSCCQSGVLPADNVVMNLVALELTVAGRQLSGAGAEHQLLAAGLHRLPRPDGIVSEILDDIKQSGTVLSEITHELALLTEGARRLGVGRVESLSRLLLDCYQQLTLQPELLQHKSRRMALGRAHRVLCRLLDQAAAWLPLDQESGGHTLSAVISDLFVQFDQSGRCSDITQGGGVASQYVHSNHLAWRQCQALNLRVRQLIRRSGNLSEYRSLITELLREQQTVIAPYLRYQRPD